MQEKRSQQEKICTKNFWCRNQNVISCRFGFIYKPENNLQLFHMKYKGAQAPPACAENMVFIVNILKSLSKQLLIIHKKGPQICKSEAPRLYRPYFFYLVENECSLRIAVTHFPLSSSLQIVDCFQQLLQFWFVYFLVENLLGIYVFV